MENIKIILSCAATALGLLITALTFIAKFVKNAKMQKAFDGLLNTGETLLSYVNEAETFADLSGAEKKAYVISKANEFADANGIEFDADAVSEKIEELMTLIKQEMSASAE